MKINRVWSMPNKWTFEVKPIKELLAKYVGTGLGWADPFAGKSKMCQYRNDLKTEQPSNLDALQFLKSFPQQSVNGVLLDPPYSHRQLFKTYRSGSKALTNKKVPMTEINIVTARIVKNGGFCISFGWNTNGIGKKRGFEIVEILVVAHGGHHNDTLVTVEQKIT